MFLTYELITTVGTLLLVLQFIWRLSHPFECTCGFTTVFARRMFKHLQQGHKYMEHSV